MMIPREPDSRPTDTSTASAISSTCGGATPSTRSTSNWAPFIALQGGSEQNAGQSFIGKSIARCIGAQIGANVTKNIQVTAAYDSIPWKTDTVFLPKNVTCNNSNFQISAKAHARVLPAAQRCAVLHQYETGLTQIITAAGPARIPITTTAIRSSRRASRKAWPTGARPASHGKSGLSSRRRIRSGSSSRRDAWYNYGNVLGAGEHQHLGIGWTLSLQPLLRQGAVSRLGFARPVHSAVADEHVLRRRGNDDLPARLDGGSVRVRRSAALQVQSRADRV